MYFLDGHVTAIESSNGHTNATVSGGRSYQVILRHADNLLDGACDCPASEGIDFCKHCVATALVLREHQVSGTLREPNSEAAMLKAYLVEQGPEVLVSEIMGILPKDPVLRERLLLQAELAAGPISAKRLKKAITKVTRSQHLWEYERVAEYFRRIEATLQNIASIADQVPAEILLETALHGIKRLNRALEEIDDSGGYRFGAQADLRELHIRALGRTDWSPERRAAHILELALADEWDQFEGVPHDYAEVLSKKGLEAFYASVQRQLANQPELSPDADFAEKYPYLRLTHYLRQRAEEREDWETLIELQQLTATSALDYERMAVLYLRKGDASGAADWLTKADTLGDKKWHGRSSLWAAVHAERCDWDAAVTAQQSAFERNGTFPDYQKLIEFADRAGSTEPVRDAAKAYLSKGNADRSWQDENFAYTLIQILRDEENWPALRETAVQRMRNPDRLLEAARWLASPAPSEASRVYERVIASLIDKKKKRSYQAATKVLLESRPAFTAVDATAFDGYIGKLREQHWRKRSFIALLDATV